MKKKLLCIVLSISMLAVFMPSMAFADSTSPLKNASMEGSYQVHNDEEFAEAFYDNTYPNKAIILYDDINLSDVEYYWDGGEPYPRFSLDIKDVKTQKNDLVSPPWVHPLAVDSGDTITINLNGHKITGNGSTTSFIVHKGSSLRFMNGTLTGGYADTQGVYGNVDDDYYFTLSGGAVLVLGGANLVLEDMTVTGNAAANDQSDVAGIDLFGVTAYSSRDNIEWGNKGIIEKRERYEKQIMDGSSSQDTNFNSKGFLKG